MRLGRTDLRLAGLPALGRRRRKLRTDLKISQQVVSGETTYVIKIPDTAEFLRAPELAWALLTVFDGSRTDAEALEELQRREPDMQLTLAELQDFADSSNPALWEKTLAERNLAFLEKIRGERRERASDQNIFYMYFSAWDPDHFFSRVIPYLRWIWSRPFVIASLVLFGVGLLLFASDFHRIAQDTKNFYNFSNKSLREFVDLWLLLLFIGFVHESAHGLTCKNFGGEVHQMGFLLMYFTPAFYTDISDTFLFDKDYKRLWAIFAGIWIEMVLCALGLIVWTFTAPGTPVNDWAYKLVLMTSVTNLVMNLNPLMKFDGYYTLCQFLKIDNFREDSFDYLKQWVRHVLSGGRVPVQRASRFKHRLFLVYAPLSILYSVLVVALVLLFVNSVATRRLGAWGWVLTAVMAWLLLRKRLAGALGILKEGVQKIKEATMVWCWRQSWQTQAGAAAVVLLLVAIPTSVKVTTDFVLEPSARAELRAPVAGLIQEVRVHEGQTVERGTVLAVLHNPEIKAREEILERRLQLAQQALAAAQARGDFGESQKQARERQRLWVEWQEAKRKRDDLELRAPLSGQVTTPLVDQRVGDYLQEGQALCTVVDRDVMRARVLVQDSELEDVLPGAPVKLKVNALPFNTFSGRVKQILPAAAQDRPVARRDIVERRGHELSNYFAVMLEFPNAGGRLREAMTGTAKIYGRRYPLAWRAARSLLRAVRSQIWF